MALTRNLYIAMMFLFAAEVPVAIVLFNFKHSAANDVPDEMRGRVMGVWSLVFGAMIPLGSLEVGAVAHWLGTPFALGFGAIICAASALVTLSVIRRREAQLAN